MLLPNIKIILIEPQTPGNIGAAARAMKTMGLSRLTLVKPGLFPHKEASIRATHAIDILENCNIADNLSDAIADCSLVIGTSIRDRGNFIPALSAKETAVKLIQEQSSAQVALVFGTESHGMTGNDIRRCNYYGYISSNPEFSSLNLASAVQIFCYEIYQLQSAQIKPLTDKIKEDYPTNKQLAYFYQQLEASLYYLGFIRKKHPGIIMRRLRGIFNRARLNNKELNILQGIVQSITQKIK